MPPAVRKEVMAVIRQYVEKQFEWCWRFRSLPVYSCIGRSFCASPFFFVVADGGSATCGSPIWYFCMLWYIARVAMIYYPRQSNRQSEARILPTIHFLVIQNGYDNQNRDRLLHCASWSKIRILTEYWFTVGMCAARSVSVSVWFPSLYNS